MFSFFLGGGVGLGVRVDVNVELNSFGVWGARVGGSVGGGGGGGGKGGCERRIEVFEKIQKKNPGGRGMDVLGGGSG